MPGDSTDDAALAAAFVSGDQDAFVTLYERHVRRIYDFVYYRTYHRETAEDITQHVFIAVLERMASFNAHKGTFSAWIHGIARNAVIDHYRALRPAAQEIEDAWDLADDTDIARDVGTAMQVDTIRSVMVKLTPKQRDIVMLRLWNGYSFPEIAEIIGGTDDAVKMAFGRAIRNIRSDVIPLLILARFLF